MNVQGTWTLVITQRLDDRDDRHAQWLVADLPEAAAHQRPGRAGQRQRHRQLPDLHPEPDRRRCRARPGRRSARRRSAAADRRRRRTRARSAPSPSIRPTPRATRSTSPAPAAASGRPPTSSRPTPPGPTWIPLTDFGPTSGVNIGSIAVFPRNNDPNQSIIIAATGEGDTRHAPGVGFLISHGRRRHLEPRRQHRSTSTASGNLAADRLRQPATASSSAPRPSRSPSIPSSRPAAR